MNDALNRKKRVTIITPALAAANNGNWRTADRWAQFLGEQFEVTVQGEYDPADNPPDVLVALHARRSASAVAKAAANGIPVCVVLTGTDLYRDIRSDPSAQSSLELASRLVVLQASGLDELSPANRNKCVVIEQSAPTMDPLTSRTGLFDLLLVGHLRAEKDPLTAARAMTHLADATVRLRQIGRADDPTTGKSFTEFANDDSRIEMLGNQPHDATRDLIRQGRILILPSLMEGGANVLIEAVVSGVPVLASRISGSIGMLGADYPGYFEVGDDQALARLIEQSVSNSEFMANLKKHCSARAHLFAPAREQRLVLELLDQLTNPKN